MYNICHSYNDKTQELIKIKQLFHMKILFS